MQLTLPKRAAILLLLALASALPSAAQAPDRPGPGGPDGPPRNFFFGGPGGPGGMGRERKLVKQFDKDNNGRLDAAERKEARQVLQKEREEGRGAGGFGGPFGGRGGMMRRGGPGGEATEVQPGAKVSPAEVKSAGAAPLYDPHTLRTFFLEFENEDWEKEMEDFHGTDVDVPAKLTVDGKVYPDVGVHFRGMSSYGTIGEGRKRSLNVTVDFGHKNQNLGGHRTLNLLNGHEDPTFLRPVLFYHIAREYIPAPKANFVKVVINGENWGIYNNVEQFNKDFVKDRFGTTKGARWKVRGNPGGQGRLAYLGDDPQAYKGIYTIKTKDDPKSWAALINFCKVLDGTPADQLEQALAPILDIDGALKFIALDNALINNDGYWIRTSDYSIYQDTAGKFYIIPQDANETFAKPGGPGGGMRFMPPPMMLTQSFMEDGDKDNDRQLARSELETLAKEWFAKLDSGREGKISAESFAAEMQKVFPGWMRLPPGGPANRPNMFNPLFEAADGNKDSALVEDELKRTFIAWLADWDDDNDVKLAPEELQKGLTTLLPPPFRGPNPFAGPPGGPRPNGPGPEMRMMPGPGRNMPPVEGVKLDPLVAAADQSKPLAAKLLAVPELREKYLSYVRDIAEKHLDWKTLGPRAQKYHAMIDAYVKIDTRKLDSYDAFQKALTDDLTGGAPFGRIPIGLKTFADQRREYLLNYKPTE